MIVLSLIFGFASGALLMLARFTIIEPWIYPLFKLDEAAAATSTTMITILAVVMLLRNLGITLGIGVCGAAETSEPSCISTWVRCIFLRYPQPRSALWCSEHPSRCILLYRPGGYRENHIAS